MRSWTKLGLLSATAAVCGAPAVARANGDQALGQSMVIHAAGGGVIYAGAGFAARPDGPPVGERTLDIIDIPDGSVPVRALLYWVHLGGEDGSVLFNDTAVTGTLIGRSANTCWPAQYDAGNFSYRADVTDLVRFDTDVAGDPNNDDGENTLSGLTSEADSTIDAQGAELVFVYGDPTPGLEETFRLIVNDGAFTQNIDTSGGFTGSLTFELPITTMVPQNFVDARFTIIGGDGQSEPFTNINVLLNRSEGRPQFQRQDLSNERDFFNGDLGPYWDDETFDVNDLLVGGETSVTWGMNTCRGALVGAFSECGLLQASDPGDGDCIIYPATFLALTFPDVDQDTVEDSEDNCVLDDNPDQTDTDDDGLGDICDDDDDNDGSPDVEEEEEGTDPLDPDSDGDGILDGPDNCPLTNDPDQTDTDGDGLGNVCDDDDDDDGSPDDEEDVEGTDPLDPDSDDDGILDGPDNCPLNDDPDQTDTDGDGQGDVCDDDDDDDGIPDDEDPCPLDPLNRCASGSGGAGGSGSGQGGSGQGGSGQGGSGQGGSGSAQGGASGSGTLTGSGTSTSTESGTSTMSGTATETGAGGSGNDLDGILASGGACSMAPSTGSNGLWCVAFGAVAIALVRRRRS